MVGMGPVLTPPKKRPKLESEPDSYVQAVDTLARQRALSQMQGRGMEAELSDLLPTELARGVKNPREALQSASLTPANVGDPGAPPTPVLATVRTAPPEAPPGEGRRGSPLMSPHDWAAANHPQFAYQRMLPRHIHDAMLQGYDRYVGVQQAVSQMGHAETREARFGRQETRFARESAARMGHADRTQSRLERESAARLSPTSPQNIPSTWSGQMGYALLTGLPEETQKRLLALSEKIAGHKAATRLKTGSDVMDKLQREAAEELLANDGEPGPKYRAWRRMKAPSVGVTPRAGKYLLETVSGHAGIPGMEGLTGEIEKDAVAGWLRAYRKLKAQALVSAPEDAAMIERYLAKYAPTPEQVVVAADKGRITPEEKGEILSIILDATQQEQLRRQRSGR